MNEIIKNSNLIHPIQGHECLSACIGNILHAKYSQITGNKIVIEGDGCRLTYDSAGKDIASTMFISSFAFLSKHDIRYSHSKKADEAEARDCLDSNLSKGYFFITKVDASMLSYNRVFSQTQNASHFINILEKTKDGYRICDGYVPTRKAEVFEGFISQETLMKAWKNKCYEHIIIYDIPDNFIDINNCISEMFISALENYSKGGYENGIFSGHDVIRNAFIDYQNDFSKERAYELNYQFRINGVLSIKRILLDYMKGRSDLQGFAEKYEPVVMAWDDIMMYFLKIAFSQKRDKYELFMGKVDKYIKWENEIIMGILDRRNQ